MTVKDSFSKRDEKKTELKRNENHGFIHKEIGYSLIARVVCEYVFLCVGVCAAQERVGTKKEKYEHTDSSEIEFHFISLSFSECRFFFFCWI